MNGFEDCELYYKPTCPFCVKVIRFMESAGIEDQITMHNTQDAAVAEELIKIGGKKQVPCLVIDGRAMYESDDIIDFLKSRLG